MNTKKRVYIDTEFCNFDKSFGRILFHLPFIVTAQQIDLVSLAIRGLILDPADQVYYFCIESNNQAVLNENRCKPVLTSILKSQIQKPASEDLVDIHLTKAQIHLGTETIFQRLELEFFANDQKPAKFDQQSGRVHICLDFYP